MRRKFWMFIHDQAEKLWHYAYYKAYPPEKREPCTYQYNIAYLNGRGEPIAFDGTATKYWPEPKL